jgi:hypothetical protein
MVSNVSSANRADAIMRTRFRVRTAAIGALVLALMTLWIPDIPFGHEPWWADLMLYATVLFCLGLVVIGLAWVWAASGSDSAARRERDGFSPIMWVFVVQLAIIAVRLGWRALVRIFVVPLPPKRWP